MRRTVVLLLLFSALPLLLLAQDNPVDKEGAPEKFTDKLVYGGNIGLNFGNVTYLGASPFVGYRVTDRFIPGIGLSYSYYRMKYFGAPVYSTYIYGASIWSRYYIFDNIFAHAEYEALNGEWDPYYKPGRRYYLNSLLAGAGYQQRFGMLSSYILLLYNFTYGYDSPYPQPLVLRVGIGVGL